MFSVICMSCGNREGISGSPYSTLKMCQCSVLYSIIIYIYSHVVRHNMYCLEKFLQKMRDEMKQGNLLTRLL